MNLFNNFINDQINDFQLLFKKNKSFPLASRIKQGRGRGGGGGKKRYSYKRIFDELILISNISQTTVNANHDTDELVLCGIYIKG